MTEEKPNPTTCEDIERSLACLARALRVAADTMRPMRRPSLDPQSVAHYASAIRDLAAAWKDCPPDLEYSE